MSKIGRPKVSVRLMTYMHESFIEEALNGIYKQKTDFLIEVVIGDDFSSDGTLEIVKKYKDTDNIVLNVLERNEGDSYWKIRKERGRLYNFTNIIDNCSGDYIALLDGDDFWTDPYKLQKQVDFLDQNPEYVACFHDVHVVDSNSKSTGKSKSSSLYNRDVSQYELQRGYVLSIPSLCYRNVIKDFPEEFYNTNLGDKFLCSLLGAYGGAKYLENIKPSSYRIHSGGIWSEKSVLQKDKAFINSHYWMWKYHERIGEESVANHFFKLILKKGNLSSFSHRKELDTLDKLEYWALWLLRRIFRILQYLFRNKK